MDAVVIAKERGVISRLWTGEVVRSPVGWIPVQGFLKVGDELDVEIVRLPFVMKARRKTAEG